MLQVSASSSLGGVYMIPAQLSSRHEFTPVTSCRSVFVYMASAQNLIPERVIPVRVHPGNCTGARFSFRYENSFRCHVNAVRPFAPAWNHSRESGTGSTYAIFDIQFNMASQSRRSTWSVPSCKHDMKSQCHTGIKLAPVRVFTCKHPLSLVSVRMNLVFVALSTMFFLLKKFWN